MLLWVQDDANEGGVFFCQEATTLLKTLNGSLSLFSSLLSLRHRVAHLLLLPRLTTLKREPGD